MTLVYLAGAIDRADNDPRMWSRELRDLLLNMWLNTKAEKGVVQPLILYAPALALGVVGSLDQVNARAVWTTNMTALDMSNLLLVRYEPGQETWGTPMEVQRAAAHNTPVVVWTPQRYWVDSGGILPLYLIAHAHEGVCYSGMRNAAKKAVELAAGQYRKQAADDSREVIQQILNDVGFHKS